MSLFAGASWRSILYCKPEQPPPTTATRSTPPGRPCRCSSDATLTAALVVNLISLSSPTRKAGVCAGLVPVFAIIAGPTYRDDESTSTHSETWNCQLGNLSDQTNTQNAMKSLQSASNNCLIRREHEHGITQGTARSVNSYESESLAAV